MKIKVNDRVSYSLLSLSTSGLSTIHGVVRGFDDRGRAIVLFDGERKARILPPHVLESI